METEKNTFYHSRFRDIVPLNKVVDLFLILFRLETQPVKKCNEIVLTHCFEIVIGVSVFEINNQWDNS